MSRLYRKSRMWRTLFVDVNGKSYEITSFVFYNKEGVIFTHDFGYLDNDFTPHFDFEISRKLKVNFNKKEAYIIKSKKYCSEGYDLYIHSDLVGLKEPTHCIEYKTIYSIYKTDIEGFEFKIYEKSLENNLNNIKGKIREEAKKLDSFYSLTSESLLDTIDKLKELQVQLKEEEENVKNYTIEDYMKELNSK